MLLGAGSQGCTPAHFNQSKQRMTDREDIRRRPRRRTAWTPELLEQVRRDFPHTSTPQLARQLGLSSAAVSAQAYRLGLRKAPGFNAKAEQWADERTRVAAGLPQKTRYKIGRDNGRIATKRGYLRELGYIVPRGSRTVYYTPETRRSDRIEARQPGERGYICFEFKPWDGSASFK